MLHSFNIVPPSRIPTNCLTCGKTDHCREMHNRIRLGVSTQGIQEGAGLGHVCFDESKVGMSHTGNQRFPAEEQRV
jgi:hypothetical protein